MALTPRTPRTERPVRTRESTPEAERKRTTAEGALSGVGAGAIFGLAQTVAAVAMGSSAILPWRLFSSVVLGSGALVETAPAVALVVGVLVHLILSAAFGALYGYLLERLPVERRENLTTQAMWGMGFAFVLWLVNFQLIARVLYPWFLETHQGLQFLLHAAFFGLPLGLLFAAAERRARVPQRPRPLTG